MTKYLTFMVILGLSLACGNVNSSENSKNNSPQVIDGKRIFKKNCIICHGLYGDMEVNGAKNLNLSILTLEERIKIITNGKGLMTPFKSKLTEKQIEAVAQYTLDTFKEDK